MSGAQRQSSTVQRSVAGDGQHDLLRFLTCGSVDDGKSTLIGRLLYELGSVPEDELAALEAEAAGETGNGPIDFSRLVDGLQAEREQGITIDVAYRYFSTSRRTFIVADTPGHEQYTRNMATGASVSDLAVLLVDARKGVLSQTRRHTLIAHLLGLRTIALVVNKMDLVAFSQERFDKITAEYRAFAETTGIADVTCFPVAATTGANVTTASDQTPWYDGPTLLEFLETFEPARRGPDGPFTMPVQWVNRPNADFRGYCGTITSGTVAVGDTIRVLPGDVSARVERLLIADQDAVTARAGDAITVVTDRDVDISRGDVLCADRSGPDIADQMSVKLIWLDGHELLPGRPYLLKCGTQTVTATVSRLKYKLDLDTLGHIADRTLHLNEIGVGDLSTSRPLVHRPYADDPALGAFILIDRLTGATAGAGTIEHALRRATNVQWQSIDVSGTLRAQQKGQTPFCLWFTGLSGSGKSTLANALDRRLYDLGHHAFVLDGDNVRHGLNRDLGFTEADRVENIRRVGEVAKLMTDAGLIAMVSFISPFRSERELARSLFTDGTFFEVFVDTPLEVCEARDPKGLYRRARAGQIPNFTGIGSPYEPPEDPDVVIAGGREGIDEAIEHLVRFLKARGLV